MSTATNPPSGMSPHDFDLIDQFKQGNMSGFEQLVQRYDRQVLSIAGTFVDNLDDAKDIYQEVFLRVYRGLPKFEKRSEFSTWLFRITTNVCLSFRSRQSKRTPMSLDREIIGDDEEGITMSESLPNGTSTDGQVVNADIAAQVRQALGTLSPQQRLVFTLRHYEGYKIKEIASMMDCAEGTVKKYLFSATQRLRERLKGVFE